MKIKRLVVKIDEEKCNGCGLCIPACAEGALRIVDGKARLVEDRLCDGLGACLGHCPQGAITVEERGCPGSAVSTPPALLGNWPVQIHLVPPTAPFLKHADLVVAADCTAFACPDFHLRFLPGRVLLVGCPKLDDAAAYLDKLAAIMRASQPQRITVVHMEVPCCYGMTYLVQQAMARAGRTVPVERVVIATDGTCRSEPV